MKYPHFLQCANRPNQYQTSKLLKRFMMKAICDCFSFTSHCYPIQKNSYQRDRTTPIQGNNMATILKLVEAQLNV